MENYLSNYSTICEKTKLELTINQRTMNMEDSKRLCRALKGEINVVIDLENSNLVTSLLNQSNCRKGKLRTFVN